MAITTPEDFIDWASNTGAAKTDPGATLAADGWVVGDAPASSHFNHLVNSSAGFASFVPKTLPSTIAYGNIDFTTGAAGGVGPWGHTNPTAFFSMFLRGRWYVHLVTQFNALNVYDSDDGETWTSSLAIDGATIDVNTTRPVVSDDGIYAFGNDDRLFVSTDNTVENLDTGTVTPWTDITIIRELVYDGVSGLWVACGSDGAGNGRIESSPDLVTWTVRDSRAADEYESLAVSSNGVFLATTDNGATTRTSSDGITWIAGPAFANAVYRVTWDELTGHFLANDSLNNLFRIPENSTSEVDTALNVAVLFQAPEFLWVLDAVAEAMTAVFSFEGTYGEKEDLGFWLIGLPVAMRFNENVGGNGRIVFPYVATDGTSQRAIAYYGANNDG